MIASGLIPRRWAAGMVLFLAACGTPLTRTAAPETTGVPATALPQVESQATPLPEISSTGPPATETPAPTQAPTSTPTASRGLPSIGDPYAPALGNSGYDVQAYDLRLRLDPGSGSLAASAWITATSQIHNLIGLSLDFAGFEISRLTVDGVDSAFRREAEKIHLDLPVPLSAGTAFSIRVDYSGRPDTVGSAYIPFLNHLGLQILGSSLYVLAEPDGAHFWFPSNDHPLDKAHFRFDITVPAGFIAAANGVLTGHITTATTETYIWEHAHPMATYLAMVAVGEYERIESASPAGIPIRHYVFPDLRSEFDPAAAISGEVLDWMAETFGPYPFEAFGFVTTRIIRFSLESQSLSILSENMLNQETVIHEIIHQWFGDWVGIESWADTWHKEGFAIYLTAVWQTGDDPQALDYYMENQVASILEGASLDPLGNLSPQRLFSTDSYWRGAALIHALRREIGDEAFFGGLRLYFERYGGGTASRTEFIALMEEASGVDLDPFFNSWLE